MQTYVITKTTGKVTLLDLIPVALISSTGKQVKKLEEIFVQTEVSLDAEQKKTIAAAIKSQKPKTCKQSFKTNTRVKVLSQRSCPSLESIESTIKVIKRLRKKSAIETTTRFCKNCFYGNNNFHQYLECDQDCGRLH